jgi:hypothetical protein
MLVSKAVSSYRCVRFAAMIFFATGRLLSGGFFGIGGSSTVYGMFSK